MFTYLKNRHLAVIFSHIKLQIYVFRPILESKVRKNNRECIFNQRKCPPISRGKKSFLI